MDTTWSNVPDDPTQYQKVSVTELYSLLRCTKKHDYGYRQGLRPVSSPSYFGKGRYLHGLYEAFLTSIAEGRPNQDVHALGAIVLARMAEQRAGGDASALVAEPDRVEINTLFASYLTIHDPGADITVLAIEQPMLVDLGWRDAMGNAVLFHGIVDALLEESGGTWVNEHKTASRAWSQGQFNFDWQSPLYNAAIEAVTGLRPDGTVFNFFYPKRFERKLRFVTPGESERLIAEIQRAINLRDSGMIVRQPHWGCNDCPFRALCHAEMVGVDTRHMREQEFTVDEAKLARFAEED